MISQTEKLVKWFKDYLKSSPYAILSLCFIFINIFFKDIIINLISSFIYDYIKIQIPDFQKNNLLIVFYILSIIILFLSFYQFSKKLFSKNEKYEIDNIQKQKDIINFLQRVIATKKIENTQIKMTFVKILDSYTPPRILLKLSDEVKDYNFLSAQIKCYIQEQIKTGEGIVNNDTKIGSIES